MKILEISNILNEQLLFDIKSKNSKIYVNKFHVFESNFTYKYEKKDYLIKNSFAHVVLHKVSFERLSIKLSIKLSRYFPFFGRSKYAWLNEVIQKNYSTNSLKANLKDDDVLIIFSLDKIKNFLTWIKFLTILKNISLLRFNYIKQCFF